MECECSKVLPSLENQSLNLLCDLEFEERDLRCLSCTTHTSKVARKTLKPCILLRVYGYLDQYLHVLEVSDLKDKEGFLFTSVFIDCFAHNFKPQSKFNLLFFNLQTMRHHLMSQASAS